MELSNILVSRRERQNIYYHLAENELLQNCLVLANRPKKLVSLNNSCRTEVPYKTEV